MWFAKSYSHFFSKNISVYAIFNDQSFNGTLTNDIISFEQLSPDRQCEKTYLPTCTPKKDSNQPANLRCLISLSGLYEETLHPWIFKMHPEKIHFIDCTGWSESSLGAHVQRYVFWHCGSFIERTKKKQEYEVVIMNKRPTGHGSLTWVT